LAAPKNAGVAAAIAGNNGAIGPLEIAYILENTGQTSLQYGTVQNAAGNYIQASVSTMSAALSAGGAMLPAANATWTGVTIVNNIFTNTTATNAYPITTLTFALVYQNQVPSTIVSAASSAALVNFLQYIISPTEQSLGTGLGYVPLPANIVAIDTTAINSITYNGAAIPH